MNLINYTRDRLNRKVGVVGIIRYCAKCGRKGRFDFDSYSSHSDRIVHVVASISGELRYTDVCIVAKTAEVSA